MALRKRHKCSEGTILPWFRLVRVGLNVMISAVAFNLLHQIKILKNAVDVSVKWGCASDSCKDCLNGPV
jgi:hypothetical protein